MKIRDLIKKIAGILSGRQKKQLYVLTFLVIIGAFFELIGVSAILPLINLISESGESISNSFLLILYETLGLNTKMQLMSVMIIILILIYVFKNTFLAYMYNKEYGFVYSLQKDVACRLLDNYLHEDYSFFLKTNSAELLRSINTDVSQFVQMILNVLLLVTDGLVVIVLSFYLLITDVLTSMLVVALLLLCIVLLQVSVRKKTKILGKKNQSTMGKMIQWLNQAFGGIKATKVSKHESYYIDKYRANYQIFAEGMRRYSIYNQIPKYVIETVIVVGILAVILIKMLLKQDMSNFLPQLSVFAVAAFRLLPAANRINGYFNTINFYYPSVDLIYRDLKDYKPEEKENDEKETIESGDIELRNISYKYPDAEESVLENISAVLKENTATALVGPSGSGKSTFADIVLGLLHPYSGEILVNGRKIKNYGRYCSRNMGYIPQSIYLSDDTIRNNIAFGIEEEAIDDNQIWKVLKDAQLDEFIKELPDGLNTVVGESGVRLSGGQRQRIGIARALYSNPSVIILDEATSALDTETESAVMEAVDELRGKKTLLIIAHRLSTLRNCDIIYEIKNKNVVCQQRSPFK
ncbi:ABC transporter ATP-binding protein [Lachnotalea sp. AF33-28]|uniref:ABC transporter ATP-binding protein n=1 Tax=Lachnotalea sp. AF33-28 TaxID=2292046 RepID=UPI000E488CBA|nr:ABC transporter ATP-binding protein [Lachnotalea sp. AF33-28]RHP35458.1 ABC transporter ATP-binding protein [Lachnotalea sp. AF33-28]